jgi:hypothetical protein
MVNIIMSHWATYVFLGYLVLVLAVNLVRWRVRERPSTRQPNLPRQRKSPWLAVKK